jgi:hypothetical protein
MHARHVSCEITAAISRFFMPRLSFALEYLGISDHSTQQFAGFQSLIQSGASN